MPIARGAALLALLLVACGNASAQTAWPDRPIRLLVTSAAGGGIDLMARLLADGLARQLPQRVVIENVAGAGGLIATRTVAKSEPDGYTLLFQGPGHASLPYVRREPGYDVRRDFASVSLVTRFPLVMVTDPKLPAKTTADFIAMVKAAPGKFSFGSSGIGGASHIPLEAFVAQAGLDMVHVPFRGSGQTTAALIAGQIHLVVDGLAPQLGYMREGRVQPLGVTTGRGRRFCRTCRPSPRRCRASPSPCGWPCSHQRTPRNRSSTSCRPPSPPPRRIRRRASATRT